MVSVSIISIFSKVVNICAVIVGIRAAAVIGNVACNFVFKLDSSFAVDVDNFNFIFQYVINIGIRYGIAAVREYAVCNRTVIDVDCYGYAGITYN